MVKSATLNYIGTKASVGKMKVKRVLIESDAQNEARRICDSWRTKIDLGLTLPDQSCRIGCSGHASLENTAQRTGSPP